MVDKATMDNILVNYADITEQTTHFLTLCNAIEKATDKEIRWKNFFFTK